MKDLKDIILEKRIREWKIAGKKIPELYLTVFNDYLEEIAESLADYNKQVLDDYAGKLAITQKALELACKRLQAFEESIFYNIDLEDIIDSYMEQAKEQEND